MQTLNLLGIIITIIVGTITIYEFVYKYKIKIKCYIIKRKIKIIQKTKISNNKINKLLSQKLTQTDKTTSKEWMNSLKKYCKNDNYKYLLINEARMIHEIVLGMTAKKFKEINKLTRNESMMGNLNETQIIALQELEKLDSDLIMCGINFELRKEILKRKFNTLIDAVLKL